MDEMTWIILLIGAGALLTILFWVAVIYFVVRLLSGSGMSSNQKIGLISGLMNSYTRYGGSSEPGPVESSMRHTAASHGIDLDR